jgi:hypothetical protein
MQSEMTHDMIRALSSDERAYFVENMIGDVFSLSIPNEESSMSSAPMENNSGAANERVESQLVSATLKEELTKQPYAGLFVMYMIDRFEELSEEDFVYWDRCCQMTEDTSMLIEKRIYKSSSNIMEDLALEESKRKEAEDEEGYVS